MATNLRARPLVWEKKSRQGKVAFHMLIRGYKYSRGAAEQQGAPGERERAAASVPSRPGGAARLPGRMTTAGSAHKGSSKEERKLRKPLIERKRRERINNCLDQLKETVVGAFHLDSKLEKADILEMTVKHLQNIQSSKMMADSKVGLEAQQRYSTGYIQCMHEVHNLLLTCEWMDKTLGARLLNHLLKSLPRSGEDACKAALRSLSPSQQPLLTQKSPLSPKGSTRGTNLSQERLYPAENKQASKNSFQLPSLSVFNQVDAAPPRQVLQPNFSHNNPRMGSLDMWRPW
ncbi:transcription cofactor HES-6-like isoform X2 [Malurus melanocephalus]|uniref:transcription cofactor HES-6-like isoform X2 n=1 Tax=Malurus melanocephalus TaxID=175006 RepID=UPI0025487559|nr:transcription cofactor HES-6-like isoform X2 [Malurus melanocephalus]